MKTCTKCLIEKPESDFYTTPGKQSRCKNCILDYNRNNRRSAKERYKLARQIRDLKNREKILEQKKEYCDKHKEEKAEYDKKYRQKNKDKIREQKRLWEQAHRHDPILKVKRNLRRRIHHVLNGRAKSVTTEILLGCSFQDFKSHLESLFQPGMTWDNYGEWHIDHIIPCYKFDLTNEEEQRRCFHYSNQRPLWAKDNLSRRRD